MTDEARSTQLNRPSAQLAGQAVLVTGAGRNLGRAMALRAAELGANVGVVVANDRAAAESVCSEIERSGRRATAVLADVSDVDQVEAAFQRASTHLGPITSVISCAAYRSHAPTTDLPLAEWRRVLSVTLDGAFHLTRAALTPMLDRGYGRFVFIGGSVAHTGLPVGAAAVATAKAALSGFVRSLAQETGGHGVTANVVVPGKIGPQGEVDLSDWDPASSSALGRNASYREVVDLCMFLCTPAAQAVQGQVLHVDGGIFGFGC
jgi:3-oxoacyl-[acyl-carrier protein] reductase